jgi:basic membrane protein A
MRTCALFLLLLLAGCGQEPAGPAPGAFLAGIVFDVGGIDDKSFNESANIGLERAKKDLSIEVERHEPKQPADRKSGLRRLCGKKASVVIGVGFIFTDEIVAAAKDFPDLKFACVDMSSVPDMPKNLCALNFREEQGAFLVGAIAGLCTKSKKVGFVGGMNVPLIHKFQAGYTAGVKHVAADCEVLVNYAGETPKAFEDPEAGKSMALGQYKSGADIIFHASGKTGLGVFQAAKETGKLAIGVDADQQAEAPGHVLTSMIKRVDVAVFETIKSAKDGSFQSGARVFGLKEDAIGFVYDENNRKLIPEDVHKRVMELRQQIIDGSIAVPDKK